MSSCVGPAQPPVSGAARHQIATISDGPALPQGRACHAAALVGGRVVVAGGSAWSADRMTKNWFADTLVIDPDGQSWNPGPPLPNAVAEMMFGSDGNALYIAGGKNGSATTANACQVVIRDGKLIVEALPPLPMALSGGAGAFLNGVFYVAGGYDAGGNMTDGLWALDVRQVALGWQSRAPMPPPIRVYPALVGSGGGLYLLGGCIVETEAKPDRQVFKHMYRYDPMTNTWSCLSDLPSAGQAWAAGAVDDDHVMLTGRGDTGIYDDVWLVDLRNSSVKGLGNLVVPSFGAPLVRVSPHCWWFIGGEPDAHKSRTPRVSVICMPGDR
ncbi:MAG: kelch repeat-containing protein [Tepidisphaeraceae bacterium]